MGLCKMNPEDWTDEQVYAWLIEHNAKVSLCYGDLVHNDGLTCRIHVKSPDTGLWLVGCANNARACIVECTKGLKHQKEFRSEYVVD